MLARIKRLLGFAPPVPRAWSFPAESVAELSRRLGAVGPGATLGVLPYADAGLLKLRLRVIPNGEDPTARALVDADINESRPCPPFKC